MGRGESMSGYWKRLRGSEFGWRQWRNQTVMFKFANPPVGRGTYLLMIMEEEWSYCRMVTSIETRSGAPGYENRAQVMIRFTSPRVGWGTIGGEYGLVCDFSLLDKSGKNSILYLQ